ncbi:hypothetical protein L210DRAFT_3396118 [Boletus edulis BED1]|uniref:Uncharacterized protein n=1 Tax=Boletus edulis BED1 TaxID=1328754 RepID=A0AAD4BZ15_BOLED|nr:hypothetical protein L210DRAFT_3396118 [Boletus edulis BED1]
MPLAANDIHRHTDRPPLPANYDGQTQTRYVNMLLALDDISPIFNFLSAFFTWILLAGFVLLPGTFASFRNEPAGSAQSFILTVVNHISLFVIALVCACVGACGMIWLWWRWHGNYIWITNRIFIPGCLNSIVGLISTLASIYGVQGGEFGRTEESAVIVTSLLSVICGILFVVYEFWFIRNLRLEHDQEVGVELAGKHGSGILEEKRDDQDTGA